MKFLRSEPILSWSTHAGFRQYHGRWHAALHYRKRNSSRIMKSEPWLWEFWAISLAGPPAWRNVGGISASVSFFTLVWLYRKYRWGGPYVGARLWPFRGFLSNMAVGFSSGLFTGPILYKAVKELGLLLSRGATEILFLPGLHHRGPSAKIVGTTSGSGCSRRQATDPVVLMCFPAKLREANEWDTVYSG